MLGEDLRLGCIAMPAHSVASFVAAPRRPRTTNEQSIRNHEH